MSKYILSVLLISLVSTSAIGARFYVDVNATGNNTGTNWANAFPDLQQALSTAIFGDEIWVAAGTYKPTSGSDRNISFDLRAGVDLYGGFNGTETTLSQRDFNTNVTILSGDIGQVGAIADNSQNVLKAVSLITNVTIDGFRVANGNGSSNYGAGIRITGSVVTIRNCVFVNNTAWGGGALYATNNSTITITNCTFSNNIGTDTGAGGGAVRFTNSRYTITDCSFFSNQLTAGSGTNTVYGGGVFSELKGGTIDRCIFAGNSTRFGGGAFYAKGLGANDSVVISNSLFVGNYCAYGSIIGFQGFSGSFAKIINSTIAHNYYDPSLPFTPPIEFTTAPMEVRNSIIWQNGPGVQVESGITVSNSIVSGGFSGNSILTADPLFASPGNYLQAPFALSAFDYHVSSLSPAIDAGNNSYIYARIAHDLDSLNRIHGNTVDLGAYELSYCPLTAVIDTSGSTTICQGSSITLTASGGDTYLWGNGSTTPSITVSAAGTYTVKVADTATGCLGNASKTVTVLSPSIAVTGNLSLCSGDTSTLTATPGLQSYLWSDGSTTPSISVFQAGVYRVTATNSFGCTATSQANVTLTQLPLPVITVTEQSGTPNDNIVCAGDAISFSASGATSSYNWSSGSSGGTVNLNPTSDFSIWVIGNSNGCSNSSDTIQIQVLPNPAVVISSNGINCIGDTTTLTATGGNTAYSWQGGSTGASISVTNSGDYIVTATNANGCLSRDTFTVIFNPLPTVSLVLPDSLNGASGALALTGGTPSGGQYSGMGVSNGNFDPQGLTAGSYTITYTYTDGNGCTSSASQSIVIYITSITEIQGTSVGIWPNPAQNTIHITSNAAKPASLKVADFTGKLLYQGTLSQTMDLDISTYPPGIYILWVDERALKFVKY